MKTYGRIDTGVLFEIVESATFVEAGQMYDPDARQMADVIAGQDIPVSWRFTPEFVATLVDITNVTPVPTVGDLYANGEFSVAPEPMPPTPPGAITMRQCRLMLHSKGLLAGVQSAIDALHDPAKTEAQIEWDFAQTVNRDNPVMKMLAGALELDSEQLDQMFMAASQL